MSSQSYAHFLVHRPAPGVAHVEINRPDKLNSFYEEMWLEFGRVFNALSVDPEIRAVVLSGAGERAFTSGLDVQKASDGWLVKGMDDGSGQPVDSARFATYARRHIAEFQDSISAMEKCEKRMCFYFTRLGAQNLQLYNVHNKVLYINMTTQILSRHLRAPRPLPRPGHRPGLLR